jgi:hypothetical protein
MEPFDADDVAGRDQRRLTRQPQSLPILLQHLALIIRIDSGCLEGGSQMFNVALNLLWSRRRYGVSQIIESRAPAAHDRKRTCSIPVDLIKGQHQKAFQATTILYVYGNAYFATVYTLAQGLPSIENTRHAAVLFSLSRRGAITTTLFHAHRQPIAEFAARNRLLAVFHARDLVEAGGLMSSAAGVVDMYHRAGNDFEKILNGAKPADLPEERPTTFELVINLKTAEALGLSIPSTLQFHSTAGMR